MKATLCFFLIAVLSPLTLALSAEPIDVGSRRELMVDTHLIDRFAGTAELRLHHPVPREVVLKQDQPWEGNNGSYFNLFKDGDIYRLYYLAYQVKYVPTDNEPHGLFACYAESKDGLTWTKPELGLVEFQGSKKNNIFWSGETAHDFTPFKDTNPDCAPEARYKAVGSAGNSTLAAFQSADGIHWKPLGTEPIIKGYAFDSQNQAFWDPIDKIYRCYLRHFHNGIRDIRVSTSKDFKTWTEPKMLKYTDDVPDEPLYINGISRYYRAPHFFVGFPTRYVERPWVESHNHLADVEHRKIRSKHSMRYGTAITDCNFMSSRDGETFHRWPEAFVRPGYEHRDNWSYGDGYKCLGMYETPSSDQVGAPNELSFLIDENCWKPTHQMRRWTIRIDGFVSVNAKRKPGEIVTKPIRFTGKELEMNFSTSAAGGIRVEIQDADGKPIPGYTEADADEIFGDTIRRVVSWKGKSDVSSLAGKPVRLRFIMSDADLYSWKFNE